MDTRYLSFVQATDTVIKSPNDRSKIIAHAIALALSNSLPLPSGMTSDASSYYTLQLLQTVRNSLSAFNEQMVFDLRCALDVTRQFWLMRYASAYPCYFPNPDESRGFFDIVSGATTYFSMDSYLFLNQYKQEVLTLSFSACAVLTEVK